jgi:iron(III) transport system permease protein
VTGRGYRPRLITLGKWRYPAFGLFLLYFVLTIALPTFALVWRSLLRYYVPPSLSAIPRISWEHYQEIFSKDGMISVTFNTLLVGISTASLTMLLSLIVAWVIVRKDFKGKTLLDSLTFLPHALPGVIIGIALVFLLFQPPFRHLQLFGTLWIVVLGLTITYIAFGSRAMNGAIGQIHRELEEAGQVSGARWHSVLRRIILPLLLPSFISGWIWVASHSLRSFSVPLMLTTTESRVLSVIMWNLWDEGRTGEATALGVLLIVALAVFAVAGRLLVSRLNRQQAA